MSTFSRDELIELLRTFARDLGDTPTRTEMNDDGPVSSTPYYTEFDSWTAALQAAGLEPSHRNDIPDSELIAELQRLADKLPRLPRFEDMAEHGTFSPHTYVRRWGSWSEAKGAAGLDEETRTSRRKSPTELKAAIRELEAELGYPPTQRDMNELGAYSHRPFYRAWDSWGDALRAAGCDPDRKFGYPKGELISELQRLANDLDRTPTFDQMNERGEYSVWPYLRAFPSWNDALNAAGLPINKAHGVVDGDLSYGASWPEQRVKALEAENYTCQECGIGDETHRAENGFGLDVHHRTKVREFEDPSNAHKLSNLVVLCRRCHADVEYRT